VDVYTVFLIDDLSHLTGSVTCMFSLIGGSQLLTTLFFLRPARARARTHTHTSLMKRQYIVKHTICQTEIPALLNSCVRKSASVKIMFPQKKFFSL